MRRFGKDTLFDNPEGSEAILVGKHMGVNRLFLGGVGVSKKVNVLEIPVFVRKIREDFSFSGKPPAIFFLTMFVQ